MLKVLAVVLVAISFISAKKESASESILNVTVVRVYDGDTFYVRLPKAAPYRFMTRKDGLIAVRVLGWDAPELKTKSALDREAGVAAKDFATRTLLGKRVDLLEVKPDKYSGRIDAKAMVDGREYGLLLSMQQHRGAPLATPYWGSGDKWRRTEEVKVPDNSGGKTASENVPLNKENLSLLKRLLQLLFMLARS